MRDRLYERVSEEAAKAQRSISEECERSLEAYYDQRNTFGQLARLLSAAINIIESVSGKTWSADRTNRSKTRAALDVILDEFVWTVSHSDEPTLAKNISLAGVQPGLHYIDHNADHTANHTADHTALFPHPDTTFEPRVSFAPTIVGVTPVDVTTGQQGIQQELKRLRARDALVEQRFELALRRITAVLREEHQRVGSKEPSKPTNKKPRR